MSVPLSADDDSRIKAVHGILNEIGAAVCAESPETVSFKGGVVPGRPIVLLTGGKISQLRQLEVAVQTFISPITFILPAFGLLLFATFLWFSTHSLISVVAIFAFVGLGLYGYAKVHSCLWLEAAIQKRFNSIIHK